MPGYREGASKRPKALSDNVSSRVSTIPEDLSGTAVRAVGLTKNYGSVPALRGVDVTIHRGQVFGVLGPNGAGKTTLLRILIGLVRPDSGTASVLGQAPGSSRALQQLGAMIESPAFVPRLSGRTNLRILARARGLKDFEVDRVLDVVGLTARGGDRVSGYSLGMGQRLGVAAALLGDPAVMILDEPTNGLDPEGVVQVRHLLRRLGAEGKTILLSSHMLHEVEQICDRVLVMREGLAVAEGPVDELRHQATGARVTITATPHEAAGRTLAAQPEVDELRSLTGANGAYWQCVIEPSAIPAVARALVTAGIDLHGLSPELRSLEDVFFSLTNSVDESTDALAVSTAADRD